MKTKTQPKIFPISIFNVRIFLIQVKHGYALIDTGIPFQEERIIRAFKSLGVELKDIQAIILTHGHLDHIGCLGFLQERTGAPVICHRSLAGTLAKGGYEKAVPRVLVWKVLNRPLSALLGQRLRPVTAHYIVEESFDLRAFGLTGSILHTPGHSPGSCSLLLDDGICLIGDLLRERSPGTVDTGLFYQDRDQILASLRNIASRKPDLIYLSHGATLSGTALNEFISRADNQEG